MRSRSVPHSWATPLFLAIVAAWPSAVAAHDYSIVRDHSIGRDALSYRRAADFWTTAEAFLIDGSVTSFPPDETTYDRSLIVASRAGSNVPIDGRFGVRIVVDVEGNILKRHTGSEPRKIDEAIAYTGRPSLDVTLLTATGIEVFGGASYHYLNAHTLDSESPSVESSTKYGVASVVAPRFGLVKRAGFGQGGFYYQEGGTAKRRVSTKATITSQPEVSETVTADDELLVPTTIGLVLQTRLGPSQAHLEFSAISAGDGGPRKANGNTLQEDYMVIRVAFDASLAAGMSLRLMAAHKTLSYSSNEDISLPLIPMTAGQLKFQQQLGNAYLFAGVIYGEANDLQSIATRNARYIIKAYGASAGIEMRF